jgi:hypothetical protein
VNPPELFVGLTLDYGVDGGNTDVVRRILSNPSLDLGRRKIVINGAHADSQNICARDFHGY